MAENVQTVLLVHTRITPREEIVFDVVQVPFKVILVSHLALPANEVNPNRFLEQRIVLLVKVVDIQMSLDWWNVRLAVLVHIHRN